MATTSTQVKQILRRVEDTPGFAVTYARSTAKVQGPNGKRESLSILASSHRAIPGVYMKLRRTGWTEDLYRQRQEEQRQERLRRNRGGSPTTPTTERTPMNGTPHPADHLLTDVEGNAWMLSTAVLDLARPAGVLLTCTGNPGWQWRGDIDALMRELWPELRTDARTAELRDALTSHLRTTNTLFALRSGDQHDHTVWWVSDDNADAASEGSKVVKLHVCGMPTVVDGQPCVYTDTRVHSVRMHRTQLGDEPHPHDGVFTCPEDCLSVRGTRSALNLHLEKEHGYQVCSKCEEAFPTAARYARHLADKHSRALETTAAPAPPAAADVPDLDPHQVAAYLIGLVSTNHQQARRIEELEARNERLEHEARTARRQLKAIERALGRAPRA